MPPQKTSSSAQGNDGRPIAAKRCSTVVSNRSNGHSMMIAEGLTPSCAIARKMATLPIDRPYKMSSRPSERRWARLQAAATSAASCMPSVVTLPVEPPLPRKSTSNTAQLTKRLRFLEQPRFARAVSMKHDDDGPRLGMREEPAFQVDAIRCRDMVRFKGQEIGR